ncbi:hypothetical protein ACQKWADRAFT_323052 [Trichoderma austrokoningii]
MLLGHPRLKARLRRLKKKPQNYKSDASQDDSNRTDASILPKSAPKAGVTHKSTGLPERLWDQAYDELKANEAEAPPVQAYEKVLSLHLRGRGDLASGGDVDEEDRIAQDEGPDAATRDVWARQDQARNDDVQVMLSAKEKMVGSAAQTTPQAALAGLAYAWLCNVCSYYKHRGLVFLRDTAKLDDWDGDIKRIEKAETAFYQDSDVHQKEKMNANLEQIVHYVEKKMTSQDLQCFKDLGITDPRYDKKRIQSTKGGLLEQSYRWILDNPDFQQWRHDEERRLLWIRGDPGKGKTMLLCGIADELRKPAAAFCQATDRRINNADAVLWGLMFMLVDQQPELMHHIRSVDAALTHACLLVDALHECIFGREKLLDLVIESLPASSRVKWIVAQLHLIKHHHPTLKDQIQREMRQKANGTLDDAEYEDPSNVLNLVMEMPGDLTNLYSLMVHHIVKVKGDTPKLCKRILSVAALASRPLSLAELRVLAGLDGNHVGDQAVERCVNKCGSFLTVRDSTVYFIHQSAKDHLTLDKPTQPIIFSSGHPHPGSQIGEIETPDPDPLRYSCAYWVEHFCSAVSDDGCPTYQKCLDDAEVMSAFLHTHFLHWLEALSLVQKISDNVTSIRKLENTQLPRSPLVRFLKDGYRFMLYFFGAIEIAPLQVYSSALAFSPMQSLVRQTLHARYKSWILNRPNIDDIWSPLKIEELSADDRKLATASVDKTIKTWDIATGACLRTLSGHDTSITCLSFLKNDKLASGSSNQDLEYGHRSVVSLAALTESKLASALSDRAVRIWDTVTGLCLQTLTGHADGVTSVAALPNNKKLASGSSDKTIRIWDTVTGVCIRILEGYTDVVATVAALADGKLASGSYDKTVKVWDIATGAHSRAIPTG